MDTLNLVSELIEDHAIADRPKADDLAGWKSRVHAACEQACNAIAPAWPLDRAIAVNPHWCRIGLSVRQVAARMAVLGGIQVFPPREVQQKAWESGRITSSDLECALSKVSGAKDLTLTPTQCQAALHTAPRLARLPLLIDVLDQEPNCHARLSWRQAITHQVSQTCAAYFDEQQADWQPQRVGSLYAFWRDTLLHDHGIGLLMGLPKLGRALEALPLTSEEAERWLLCRLGLPHTVWADYLEAVLLTVNGWASWCAYLGWQAQLEGRVDPHLRELLAIRLAWGAILLECKDHHSHGKAFIALQEEWSRAPTVLKQAEDALVIDEVWQVALEVGYQRTLANKLVAAAASKTPLQDVEVQAAFCIDVRSEPMRRALEASYPAIQTIGFAGFFGLPVAYTPLATLARRPQLPGLLAPSIEVSDRIAPIDNAAETTDEALQNRARKARLDSFGLSEQWSATSRWPSAAFSFVEAAGIGYIGKLWQWLKPGADGRALDDLSGLPARYRHICRPQVTGLGVDDKVALATRVLHAMGLDRKFAPLVLLVGHGSQSSNNAQSAALDCGACCGQTGEVNARSLALLLNDSAVRQGLERKGISVPAETAFVAALHNTTTDEIEGFDLDLLSPRARERWNHLQPVLATAGDQVRRERAPKLGVVPRPDPKALLDQLCRRANDGAQTRPEWGLAGNAAFLIAPRERSRGLDLGGRAFLHDYNANKDADGSVLELLMTAPMVVAHWINWQYHASSCDSTHLGSGNKLLHNVVGGHIGVFEGNGGDLRIGLSHQSLHDGSRWVHEPLRLTVVIDAPQEAIEAVIKKHDVVRQLLDNGWLYLWRFDQAGFLQYHLGTWRPVLEAVKPPRN